MPGRVQSDRVIVTGEVIARLHMHGQRLLCRRGIEFVTYNIIIFGKYQGFSNPWALTSCRQNFIYVELVTPEKGIYVATKRESVTLIARGARIQNSQAYQPHQVCECQLRRIERGGER
jgi:hypothetical protein